MGDSRLSSRRAAPSRFASGLPQLTPETLGRRINLNQQAVHLTSRISAGLLMICACQPRPTLGDSSISASGVIQAGPHLNRVSTDIAGVICERYGWIVASSRNGRTALSFDPGRDPLSVREYPMQTRQVPWDGWINTGGMPSLHAVRGTTTISSITVREVRGTIDWIVALGAVTTAPDTTLGKIRVRGNFRAARYGNEDCVGT
jgi:hypothetical protein